MNATQLFTVKYHNMLSVGRVQTPTLAMLVEREKKIEQFAAAKYYSVVLNCGKFTAESDKIEGQPAAEQAVSACGKTAEVKNVIKEQKNANPPKLYDLTTLQRDANKLYGYTAQQTLDCAQKLYENKLMTYPRTDSNYITEDMRASALETVKLTAKVFPFGESYETLSAEPDVDRLVNNDKVSDHHALLPTKEISRYNFNNLTEECYNVLCLVAARLLCAVSPKHTFDTVTAELSCGDTMFTAKGKTVVQGGWKQLEADIKAHLKGVTADSSEDDEEEAEKNLPPLEVGKEVAVKGAKLSEHKTSPPKRYTEDMLLSAMEHAGNEDYDDNEDVEKKGLGTPATRAAIIETLVKRQYVERKGKQLIPTDKGRRVIDVVPDNVKSAKMTAEWETTLQRIAKGQASDEEFLSEIIDFTKNLIRDNKTEAGRNNNPFRFSKLPVIGKCPKCGKNVYAFPKSYSCEDSRGECGFYFPKEMWGKEISETQAKRVIEKGSSITLKGFTTRLGDTVSGKLVLNENKQVRVEIEK